MELSKRLQAVANLVTVGYKTADIGTDHAYIPIYLIQQERIPSAIAMDINKGPLERAKKHVEENGLSEQICLRLSDGLEMLQPEEAQSIVIAGMGGGLICRILKNSWAVTQSLEECILQPQSEIAKVRAFLLEEGFLFIQEDMVLEEGKYYPMMKVHVPNGISQMQDTWSETELRYGKYLLKNRHPVLKQFLEKELFLKQRIRESLVKQDSEKAKLRIPELEVELEYIRKGLEYYVV